MLQCRYVFVLHQVQLEGQVHRLREHVEEHLEPRWQVHAVLQEERRQDVLDLQQQRRLYGLPRWHETARQQLCQG
jgi:hypothetical protein